MAGLGSGAGLGLGPGSELELGQGGTRCMSMSFGGITFSTLEESLLQAASKVSGNEGGNGEREAGTGESAIQTPLDGGASGSPRRPALPARPSPSRT